jgi:hypothetical protein
MFALGVMVTLAGLAQALWTHPWWVGASAAGFGFVLGWLGRPAWWRERRLWLDAEGIAARKPGFAKVAWRDLDSCWVDRVEGRVFLFLVRSEAARKAAPRRWAQRTLAGMTRAPDLVVPIDLLDETPDRIGAAVEIARRAAEDAGS